MSQTLAIARRELSGLFYSPIGYIVLALYLLFVGLLFALMVFQPGQLADPGPMFQWNHLILIFLVPFMTMSLFSEEYRSGRMEALRTGPVTELQIVLGKFLGAMAFYSALIASSFVFVIILSLFGRPDYMPVLTSYFGLLLMGAMMVAIGLFFSACTEHQILAAMSSCVTLVTLGILCQGVASLLSIYIRRSWAWAGWIQHLLNYLAIEPQMANFARGVIDTEHVVYFLSGTFLFLFLTYVVIESRKWR
jgi:ABC-2 type transport system permease protein